MNQKMYSPRYFKENLPDWKRKKDSVIVRYFFRPVSFFTASFFANRGIGANDVSIISIFIAILAAILYIPHNIILNILGALSVCLWMVLDCTDGNIARCVKKEPFGEFVDATSSYILINFLYATLGIAAYFNNGVFVSAGSWILIFLGVFTGSADSLARLLYQKYNNCDKTGNKAEGSDSSQENKNRLVKLHDRIDKELGLNGILLPALLICTIFGWYDVFVIAYFCFFSISLLATAFLLVLKVKKMMRAGENNADR